MSAIDPLTPTDPLTEPQEPAGPRTPATATSSELDEAKKAGMKLLAELKAFAMAAAKLATKSVRDVRSKSKT